MKFENLIKNIKSAHDSIFKSAVKAVNIHLTFRNLITGFYIVEYEQKGAERAEYGSNLLKKIAEKLKIKGLTAPELSRCRQLYQIYFPVFEVINNDIKNLIPEKILGTVSQEFKLEDKRLFISVLTTIPYSHLVELIKIENPIKRKFYELLIIDSRLTVRELRRQIQSLAFERVGLSENNETAYKQLKQKIKPTKNEDLVKNHYFFEFLKINNKNLIEESELEQSLITHLQEFIIELGNGFCLEARQKRLLIGDEYFFVDLVFYHRILKCHILIELKTKKAKHEHIGQLKAYLQHYKNKIKQIDDNPPVGILLVTDKNETLVEYAIAESDKEIFVSKYSLQLPKKEQLVQFIKNELSNR